jgi:biotin carboxyl carrier protein
MTEVKAELVGSVWKITSKPGDKVAEDDVLLILEAMKMENSVNAEKSGVVKSIHVATGDSVSAGDVVAEIE